MAKVRKHTAAVETSQIMASIIFYFSFLFWGGFFFCYFNLQYVAFKGHISTAAGTLCILNAQCRTVFSLSVESVYI